jgi:nuclear pore complex protein Nup98-Nup96
MSFGFGSGGFGQNTQNQSSTFGGFGANNTSANTGFGGSSGTTGFGSGANTGTTGTGMFGGTGSTGGGFGANTSSAFGGTGGFGSKPAFGTPATTSAGGGLFGSGATTTTAGGTGFGGFGGSNTTTTTPFGGGSTSLFGSAKPATTGFGTGTSTFGTGSNTGGGGLFGSGTAAGTTGFGATTNPGIGANIGDPPGTAVVAFSPTVEKEPNNPAQSNSFQNLLFMDAYKKWSADELRLTDYNQGRKTGGTGGTGAFGGSNFGGGTTGFGTNTSSTGFGTNTGTGMFGNTQPAATGFGATNSTTTGGFGSGGGGLFGNKPATGGLFGTSTTTQPAQTGTGGIFGGGGTGAFGSGSATTNTGFGANTGTTGGGLFGNTNTTASKPGGFSFGNTGASTGGGAFGGTTATPGFGANTTATNTGGGGLFGNTAQTNTTGGGLFGNQQQQQPQQAAGTGFGGGAGFGAQTQNTGGGLFGNQQQQQKPGGLFGSSTTNTGATGGLFGGGNTGTTSAFGGTTAAQPAAGGGLFGNKPAGTSGGLFGNNTTAQTGTTSGGLFGNLGGNTQTQQPAQGGLFGGLGQSSQAKPSLFGNSAPAGGGLFGNQPAQQQQGGLFGASTNQQQPQQGMLGNSLLGGSQGQQMPQQAFNASIHDISAYGAATLFSGLPDDKIQNPGPLATPLSGASKVKSRSILPMYKLSPANASRLVTPQKRGYGFSYSAYGSPASPSSVSSTPGGFSQSLLVGSVNRSLGKSISASNLRRSFNVEDSILQPGAFSANSSTRLLGGASNHKKLVINKEMRSDLFTSPNKEKQVPEDANGSRKLAKRVSFDTSTVETTPESRPAALENGSSNDDQDQLKPSTTTRPSANGVNGAKSSPSTSAPEMEQVKGNELAIVPEEASPVAVRAEKKLGSTIEPGGYWMSPSIEEIRAMNRVQRQRIPDFTVGRENVGSVTFKIPVDLSNINLDELFDGIVVLVPRSATVYPVAAKKPPVGKGLNVPAVISLEHSYPRGGLSTTGRRLERHIERLKTAIPDTTFESYDKETGVWTFSVEHFTTYGLGDDDDDDDETEIESIQARRPIASPSVVKDSTSPSDPDDTFEFRRSRRAVPGAFDEAALSDNEEVSDAAQRQARSL